MKISEAVGIITSGVLSLFFSGLATYVIQFHQLGILLYVVASIFLAIFGLSCWDKI